MATTIIKTTEQGERTFQVVQLGVRGWGINDLDQQEAVGQVLMGHEGRRYAAVTMDGRMIDATDVSHDAERMVHAVIGEALAVAA